MNLSPTKHRQRRSGLNYRSVSKFACDFFFLFIQLSQSSLFKRAQRVSIPRTICTNCHCTFPPSIIELYSKPRKKRDPDLVKRNSAKEIIFAYTDPTN